MLGRNNRTDSAGNNIGQLAAYAGLFYCLTAAPVLGGPPLAAGDLGLRHDIQMLADYHVISGPVTSWPVDWRSIESDIRDIEDRSALPPVAIASLDRVEARLSRGTARFRLGLAGAERPSAIRGFQNTPREDAELSVGLSWHNEYISLDLNVQGVDEPADGDDVRPDGSEIGINIGNWTLAASTMDRWWGPGWDGGLILSNNARPIPALTLRRGVTSAFESKWLRWIGPWDLRVIWGQMESERVVPDPRFFGMRASFRPHPSLEIGLSRTAQWCGDGRPCDFDTFADLFLGKDNLGDAGINAENEPGNQLAGADFRWSNTWFGTPMAFYGQIIGEDEAGGLPSRPLAMGGFEFGGWSEKSGWSYRWFAEVAGTSCDFVKEDRFNCAYNHAIYQTGYRYRSRVIGHALENDAFVGSLGLVVTTAHNHRFHAMIRSGELNRGGSPDLGNTITPTPLDMASVDISYTLPFGNSRIEIGAGYEELDDPGTGLTTDNIRSYLKWRYIP